MADAVRRLVRITINNTGDAGWTADAAERIGALADALEPALPAAPPPRYGALRAPKEPHEIFPYDPVLGLYNPLALPIEMEWRPPRAIGHARFDTPYEGPPGCLHGAILAAAFDQVINVANILGHRRSDGDARAGIQATDAAPRAARVRSLGRGRRRAQGDEPRAGATRRARHRARARAVHRGRSRAGDAELTERESRAGGCGVGLARAEQERHPDADQVQEDHRHRQHQLRDPIRCRCDDRGDDEDRQDRVGRAAPEPRRVDDAREARKNTNTGISNVTPNARNIRVVSANTSRMLHADCTRALS